MILPYSSKIPQWFLTAFRTNSNLYNTATNLTSAGPHWALKSSLSCTFLLLLQRISGSASMHCFLKLPCLLIGWNSVLFTHTFTTLLFNTIFTCLTKLSSGLAAYPICQSCIFFFQNTSRLSLLLTLIQVIMTFQIDYCNLHLMRVLTSTLAHPMGYLPLNSQKDLKSYFRSYYFCAYNPSTGSLKGKEKNFTMAPITYMI